MNFVRTESNDIGPESGSLIYDGIETIKSEITLIEYNKKLFKKDRFEKCRRFKNEDTIKG